MIASVSFKQRGVALLSMLLVFAIVATLTGSMLYKNRLEIKGFQTLLRSAQAVEYARGGIVLAELWLQRYRNPEKAGMSVFQPPEGDLAVYISDEMGKFNLNNLRDKNGAVNAVQLAVLQRLFVALEIDPQLAVAVADWVDADISSSGSVNTEDLGYANRPTIDGSGYRAANQPVAHISELLLVAGFSSQVVEKLKPYISALPVTTGVNVNTASPLLLEALMPGLQGQALVAARDRTASGFVDLDRFLTDQSSAGVDIPAALLTTVSNFYLVTSRGVYRDQPALWQALIRRSNAEGADSSAVDLFWDTQTLWLQRLPFWSAESSVDYYE